MRQRKSAHLYHPSTPLFSRLELLEPQLPQSHTHNLRISTTYQSSQSNQPSQTNSQKQLTVPHHSHHPSLTPTLHKHVTVDHKQPRRVAFKSTVAIKRNSEKKTSNTMCKKIKLIINNKPSAFKKQKKGITSIKNIKTFKSLDSSFACLPQPSSPKSTRRTIKPTNPELPQCQKIAEQILTKLNVFQDSKFCQKQLMGWLTDYFDSQKSLCYRIFLKKRKKNNCSCRVLQAMPQIQRNRDVILSKLQIKLKDKYTGFQEFITPESLQHFSNFLQLLYIQKNKIKMKQIQECISNKMTQICTRLHQKDNQNYQLLHRQKSTQIINFMKDLEEFENNVGHLKKIPVINRNRFKILNDTDLVVDEHIAKMNKQADEFQQRMEIQLLQ